MDEQPYFICALCRQEFAKERSDAEAWAEARRKFGHNLRPQDCDVVCEGCALTLAHLH